MSTQTTTCSHCGAAAPADASYCPDCGSPLAEVRTFGTPPTVSVPPGIGRRLSALRIRSRALVESLSAQSVARRELSALHYELEQLRAERESALRELGLAVYEGDDEGTERGRVAIGDLDREIAAKEERMAGITLEAQAHVAQVRAESQRTMLLEPEGATPVPVPEPYPPPDEGTPPTPAPVPEPYPPPDEGDPPQPG